MRPRRSFNERDASPIISASNPTPAMTPNRSPLKLPTSMTFRSSPRATSRAAARSCGMPRLPANRFDVPAGITATGACDSRVRATTFTARCTVPSPPHTRSRSGPSAKAARAAFGTFLLFATSYQETSSWPLRLSSARSSGSPPPTVFFECASTAIFIGALSNRPKGHALEQQIVTHPSDLDALAVRRAVPLGLEQYFETNRRLDARRDSVAQLIPQGRESTRRRHAQSAGGLHLDSGSVPAGSALIRSRRNRDGQEPLARGAAGASMSLAPRTEVRRGGDHRPTLTPPELSPDSSTIADRRRATRIVHSAGWREARRAPPSGRAAVAL